MDWNAQQTGALDDVGRWLNDPNRQVYRLFGYAGTGKTTLAKHLAQGVKGNVLFGAFTGKAAYVLQQKGCVGATTIHSLIYQTRDRGQKQLRELESQMFQLKTELGQDGLTAEEIAGHRRVQDLRRLIQQEEQALRRPFFSLNTESPVKDAKLVVIDECSMVDESMGLDLLSFGAKVLVLGDPAQLPPIGGAGFFTEKCKPDKMLTDVRRQAENNPIIHMATKTRLGETLPFGDYGASRVLRQSEIDANDALQADQLLVGRNATRRSSNNRVRALNELGGPYTLPVPGDRLVCLRNNHEKGLLNGAIWRVAEVPGTEGDIVYMLLEPEGGGQPVEVSAHAHHFQGRESELAWWDRKSAEEFDYGYALTVHKSQGSQWDRVMLFDESYCFKKDRWRWLYTGITRAAEQLDLVRMSC